jgi:hypothetical protein
MRMMKHWKGERCDAKLPGSARGSRAGDRVLAIANFQFSGLFGRNSIRARCILLRMPPLKYFGEAAECARDARALQNKRTRFRQGDGYSGIIAGIGQH